MPAPSCIIYYRMAFGNLPFEVKLNAVPSPFIPLELEKNFLKLFQVQDIPGSGFLCAIGIHGLFLVTYYLYECTRNARIHIRNHARNNQSLDSWEFGEDKEILFII